MPVRWHSKSNVAPRGRSLSIALSNPAAVAGEIYRELYVAAEPHQKDFVLWIDEIHKMLHSILYVIFVDHASACIEHDADAGWHIFGLDHCNLLEHPSS